MAIALAQQKIFFKEKIMETNISIRVGTVEDISSIQQIAFSTWPVAYSAILSQEQLDYMLNLFYSEDSLRDQMKNGHTFLMAELHTEIIGFASFNLIQEHTFKLQKLYVLPGIQEKGAGKVLLNEVVHQVQNLGAKKLQLNVNRNNNAIWFYENMGFVIIKEDDINIGQDFYMNDYVMEKTI